MNKILRLFFVSNAVSTPLLFIKESTRDISVITNRIGGGGARSMMSSSEATFFVIYYKG